MLIYKKSRYKVEWVGGVGGDVDIDGDIVDDGRDGEVLVVGKEWIGGKLNVEDGVVNESDVSSRWLSVYLSARMCICQHAFVSASTHVLADTHGFRYPFTTFYCNLSSVSLQRDASISEDSRWRNLRDVPDTGLRRSPEV